MDTKSSKYPKEAGIYKLTCKENGKVYIGKSVNIHKRFSYHKNSKGGSYFQNAIIKHGWDSFKIEILEIVENFDKLKDNISLLKREAYYIELFDSTDKSKGYNLCKYSTDGTGRPLSDEHREKIRQCNFGRKHSEETKEKMRQVRLGIPRSEETKEKLRIAGSERTLTEGHKEKIRQFRKGIKHSEETKEKIRKGNLGKIVSDETREKLRICNKQRKKDRQTKIKYMNNTYTHISIIIDRSGSMGSCWDDVVGGYAQIVKDNKELPDKCTFTVAAFDTEYELIEDFTSIKKVDEKLKVNPRGGTALLDAIGKTIVSVGEKLAKMKEKDRPAKVICLVQTDGQENASREFTRDSIKKLIDEHTNKYSWQFQFLGASLESVNEARTWGFNAANTSVYNTQNSSASFGLVGEKMKSMRSASMDTYAATCSFSDADKEILNKKVETTAK